MTTTQTKLVVTARERYIDGLRVLAAALEASPDLPLPYDGSSRYSALHWSFYGKDSREQMALAARLLPCAWAKEFTEADPDGEYPAFFRLLGQMGGLHVRLIAERDAVCRKVVTGTREVTEEIPDPDAPKVRVTRVVEDVEWDCGSLLRPVAEADVAELAG